MNNDTVLRLPEFSHAVIAGETIYVSGMIGASPGFTEPVAGGVGAETTCAFRNIELILAECGATLADIVRVNVYLTDMQAFAEMNEAYSAVMGSTPPARITVGCNALALGALVELECIAHLDTVPE
ncbi:RidA family protein [Actinomadura sp. KC06]|uniref:RidA family protein n=1 Tax=Actinomadura sp. KC06 TaxID=2530369 RepID=UPI00140461BA|nr:RidA family protein [Actinomadura sp. KC06]